MRNRRYVMRKGPLVVFANDEGISKAFRNLPGVEVTSVDRLNLLQLAPGGHLGRFCIWSKSAFEKLDKVFGTATTESEQKKGYKVRWGRGGSGVGMGWWGTGIWVGPVVVGVGMTAEAVPSVAYPMPVRIVPGQ